MHAVRIFSRFSIDRLLNSGRWCVRDFQILSRRTQRIHTEKGPDIISDVHVFTYDKYLCVMCLCFCLIFL